MVVFGFATTCSLVAVLVLLSGNMIRQVDAFIVRQSSFPRHHALTVSNRKRTARPQLTPLQVAPSLMTDASGIVESISGFNLGDASAIATATVPPALDTSMLLIVGVAALTTVFLTIMVPVLSSADDEATTTTPAASNGDFEKQEKDYDGIHEKKERTISKDSSRHRRVGVHREKRRQETGTMGRRGTLTTLVGGAMSFAASDMILGQVGNVLVGSSGGGIAASTVYGARWNGLFSRIATAGAQHGETAGAIASPELVAWISKTPAALLNPELRAWIAAQRAFGKSRALASSLGGAAAVVEEGMAAAAAARTAVAATAAAAVTTKQKKSDTKDDGESTAEFNTTTSTLR